MLFKRTLCQHVSQLHFPVEGVCCQNVGGERGGLKTISDLRQLLPLTLEQMTLTMPCTCQRIAAATESAAHGASQAIASCSCPTETLRGEVRTVTEESPNNWVICNTPRRAKCSQKITSTSQMYITLGALTSASNSNAQVRSSVRSALVGSACLREQSYPVLSVLRALGWVLRY